MINEDDDQFSHLLFSGAIEICGIDEQSGEMLFRFTEKLKEIDPILYKKMTDSFYRELLSLWEKGFISMDITEESPMVSITEKALDALELGNLNIEQRLHLEDIIKKTSKEQ
jgi:hypothetical protein